MECAKNVEDRVEPLGDLLPWPLDQRLPGGALRERKALLRVEGPDLEDPRDREPVGCEVLMSEAVLPVGR